MRTVLDRQIIVLRNQIAEMGLLCEEALNRAMRALREKDLTLAAEVIKYDDHINIMEKEIQSLCYSLLVRQQPVASDFRFISASLKIVTDLERIGDYATDISEIVIEYSDDEFVYQDQLVAMNEDVIVMLRDSIEALMSMDIELANKVINYDDHVDKGLDELKKKITDDMMSVQEHQSSMLDAFMIAKYFERCGDRCVNIANAISVLQTGE